MLENWLESTEIVAHWTSLCLLIECFLQSGQNRLEQVMDKGNMWKSRKSECKLHFLDF